MQPEKETKPLESLVPVLKEFTILPGSLANLHIDYAERSLTLNIPRLSGEPTPSLQLEFSLVRWLLRVGL